MKLKTHQELVEKIASIMFHSWVEGEDDDEVVASDIISTIYEAEKERLSELEKDPFIPRGAADYIRNFLTTSPLNGGK